jgi:rhodanese-related sulfurtransferase
MKRFNPKTDKRKRWFFGAALICALFTLSACTSPAETASPTAAPTAETAAVATAEPASGVYRLISAADAKKIMDEEPDAVVLDVREQSEYDAGHIPGAVLLPLGSIEQLAASTLPDKDATILVYCRSGRRSKLGAETLLSLGYTNVLDIGGISSWPYDVVTD